MALLVKGGGLFLATLSNLVASAPCEERDKDGVLLLV